MTFQETVYLQSPLDFPASKDWELEILCFGSITPEEKPSWDNPGSPREVSIDGLQVVSAYCMDYDLVGHTELEGHLLDWLDSEVNRAYWYGRIPEGLLEDRVLGNLDNEGEW